jgi:hypothetical protein
MVYHLGLAPLRLVTRRSRRLSNGVIQQNVVELGRVRIKLRQRLFGECADLVKLRIIDFEKIDLVKLMIVIQAIKVGFGLGRVSDSEVEPPGGREGGMLVEKELLDGFESL